MTEPTFETLELRARLKAFLDQKLTIDGEEFRLGSIKLGVYAFFDYDGEPIYVGQTWEQLGTRIRRHLTNQRTDAVAMKVLDPYEVHKIEVWPLVQYQKSPATGRAHLNWLEHDVFQELLAKSKFQAVLNEKDPSFVEKGVFDRPRSFSGVVISEDVYKWRSHKDTRIARRAETLANLAKVISERQVNKGLRRTLLTQAKRLAHLADARLSEFADLPDEEPTEPDE